MTSYLNMQQQLTILKNIYKFFFKLQVQDVVLIPKFLSSLWL